MTRLILPAVAREDSHPQRAAQQGQGCLDELDQWRGWLLYVGNKLREHGDASGAEQVDALAGEVAIVRTRLYLRARAVIEGGGAGVAAAMDRERETV